MAQLDAGVENARQILYQFPEIHPLVGGEEKQDFAAVKGVFRRNQLHIQPVIGDFVQADFVGPLFLGPVFRHLMLILGRGLPQHGPQGGHHVLPGDGMVAGGAQAVFRPPGGIDNQVIAGFAVQAGGVKIINLLSGPELDIHHFHRGFRFLRRYGQGFFFHDSLLSRQRRSRMPDHWGACSAHSR